MKHREQVIFLALLLGLLGSVVLFGSFIWLLWHASLQKEENYIGGLASVLGERTEKILLDTRDMLAGFDDLKTTRCSKAHLKALQDAAIARPYIRSIGYWRAEKRVCGVGLLATTRLTPDHADRIYPSGVIAWWPSKQTEVGGVQLFLMRYGEHDVAIDPRSLLDLGPTQQRQAGLWVEGLPMASTPWGAELPKPDSIPVGLTIDSVHQKLVSRFSHNDIIPIDIVAIEPITNFWHRYARTLIIGAGAGLALVIAWLYVIFKISRNQLSVATQLRQALARRKIKPKYQPVVDIVTGDCIGAEALARWERHDGKQTGPNVFIPVAEEAGLVPQITSAVIEAVIKDLGNLLQQKPGFGISINLSPEDLEKDDFHDTLAASLQAANLENQSIKLEITERALVNSDAARGVISELRRSGHQIAIDDFGTGYSSLSYLESFELDILKIDKSFVDAINTGSATSNVIDHVIEMAKSLGLEIIAEGVETQDQLSWLHERGVRYVQGYIFSKPLSAREFIAYSGKPHQTYITSRSTHE